MGLLNQLANENKDDETKKSGIATDVKKVYADNKRFVSAHFIS